MEKNEKRYQLTEKQLEARESFMNHMKDEIDDIQYNIDHIDQINHKIKSLRKFKQSLLIGKIIAPYIVAAGITFGSFSALGKTPFFTDDIKKHLEIKKEFDSLGNIHTEEQYGKYEEKLENLTYYGKWQKNKDNIYEREVRVYSIQNINEDLVYEIFDNIDNISLENLLGGNYTYIIEKRNNISQEEIDANLFFEAVTYDIDKNDYIMAKEEIADNVALTFLWMFFTYVAIKGVDFIREKQSSVSFYECMKKIKEQYPLVSREELNKKLEIKMDNYKRLMR